MNFIFVLSHQAVLKYSGCGDKCLSQATNVMLRDLDPALIPDKFLLPAGSAEDSEWPLHKRGCQEVSILF